MKSMIFRSLVILAATTTSQAATLLIGASTRNGDFETNTGLTYATMANWFNTSVNGSQTTNVRSTPPETGSYAALVTLASNPTINTGHSITAADSFSLGFSLRDNAAGGDPVVYWELFYYGNEGEDGFNEETSTDRLVLFSGNASETLATYQPFTSTTAAVASDSAAIGSTLYLRFYRPAGDGQFPTIDNVTLNLIPEPSVTLLGGLGLALVMRRRRA